MKLGIERLRRIMDDEQRGMLIDGPAERIAEAAYQQGARDMRERCAKACECEKFAEHLCQENTAYNLSCDDCAESIRALKDGE